jgi:hypothetical protein
MTVTDRPKARRLQVAKGLVAVGTLMGAGIAFLEFWEELAFVGAGASFLVSPDRNPEVVRLYPGLGESPWPSAAVFTVGARLVVVTLTALRLSAHPQLGGKLIWRGVLIAGIAIALYFGGIVDARAGNTGSLGLPLTVLGVGGVVGAVCVALAGVASLTRARRQQHASKSSPE